MRFHVPLPDDQDKRVMIQKILGEPVCEVLNDTDWKSIMFFTTG